MIIFDSYIDFDKTAESGQCFRWVREGSKWSVIVEGRKAVFSRIDEKRIEVDSDFEDEKYWRTYLGLEHDYDMMFRKLCESASEDTQQAYESAYGIVILNQPFFETCISFLISQNNNIPRIKKIIGAICENTDGVFPTPSELGDLLGEQNFGLGYRHEYLRDFCARWNDPALEELRKSAPLSMRKTERKPLEDALSILTSFTGIGPKVASCIALFSLGYIGCVPRDVWIKRAEEEYDLVWDEEYAGYQQQLVFFWQQSVNRAS